MTWGTTVAQWLRCCTTNRKVAGSIPDGVMTCRTISDFIYIYIYIYIYICVCVCVCVCIYIYININFED